MKLTGRALVVLEFELRTPREEVGLELQILPAPEPALVVMSVGQNCQLTRTSDSGPGVCPGDIIVEVDRKGGSPQKLFQQLKQIRSGAYHLSLSLRTRPKYFKAELVREGASWQRLGLSVVLKSDKGFMLIAAVHEVGL